MGETGLMFYSTESSAVLENVVFAPKFTDRGLQRAITLMGRYLVKNFFMIGEDQNALCGGWGGSHFETSVALTTSTLKDLAANMDWIGFDNTVYDYSSITGTSYVAMFDGCAVSRALDELKVPAKITMTSKDVMMPLVETNSMTKPAITTMDTK